MSWDFWEVVSFPSLSLLIRCTRGDTPSSRDSVAYDISRIIQQKSKLSQSTQETLFDAKTNSKKSHDTVPLRLDLGYFNCKHLDSQSSSKFKSLQICAFWWFLHNFSNLCRFEMWFKCADRKHFCFKSGTLNLLTFFSGLSLILCNILYLPSLRN